MTRTPNITRTCAVAAAFALHPLVHAGNFAVYDDFEDGTLDPAWQIELIDALGWTFEEAEGELRVTDIEPAIINEAGGGTWAEVALEQSFAPLDDFELSADIAWEGLGDAAMQILYIYLYQPDGTFVAYAGYADAWIGHSGNLQAGAGGDSHATGPNSVAFSGELQIDILREAGNITIKFGDNTVINAFDDAPIGRVKLRFFHYAHSGGSFFGEEAVRTIQLSGTPVCAADVVSSATFQPPPDGTVDPADLAYLLGEWGRNPGSPADTVSSDTFAPPPDGMVDAADLAFLLGAWGACE